MLRWFAGSKDVTKISRKTEVTRSFISFPFLALEAR